jgi:putative ABC transport system permease protein
MSELRSVRWRRVLALRAGSLAEGVRISLDSLRGNLFRSLLTILGVGIGVAVVVLMAAVITGIRTTVSQLIESSGPRNLYVMRSDPTNIQLTLADGFTEERRPTPILTSDEADRIGELPAVRSALLRVFLGSVTLEAGSARITGVSSNAESEAWPEYRPVEFVQGRNFVAPEVLEARSVAVISDNLASDLFPGVEDVVGLRMRTTSSFPGSIPLTLTVVGVVQQEENVFDEGSVDHFIVVPYTTALNRMGARQSAGEIVVVPQPLVALDEAEDQIIALLRGLRGLPPAEENNFAVVRSTAILDVFNRFTAVFFIVMLALSSVGLLVGGVGVVGIMMISVTERTREIGIRKAIGATKGEILWQFLVEAAVLTVLGGAAGLMLGGGLAWALAGLTPVPARVPLWSVAAALAMAAVTGVVFGLVPAIRAARMEPVEALGHE